MNASERGIDVFAVDGGYHERHPRRIQSGGLQFGNCVQNRFGCLFIDHVVGIIEHQAVHLRIRENFQLAADYPGIGRIVIAVQRLSPVVKFPVRADFRIVIFPLRRPKRAFQISPHAVFVFFQQFPDVVNPLRVGAEPHEEVDRDVFSPDVSAGGFHAPAERIRARKLRKRKFLIRERIYALFVFFHIPSATE